MNKRTSVLAAAGVLALAGLTSPDQAGAAAAPTCFGRTVTIMGTPGDDNLVGQGGVADVINGLGGNDIISGGAFYFDDDNPGNEPDYLCGGRGDDNISGSPGDDHINGGDGNDRVRGNNGSDVEQGNDGNDRVGSGSFADLGVRPDIMRGGQGADEIFGDWGHDTLEGGAGPDHIVDEECDSTTIHGNGGDDSIESYITSFGGENCSDEGDPQGDTITGNAGVDTVVGSPADSISTAENVSRL
jgi:Ca2+-binding RTX toxin-like protein